MHRIMKKAYQKPEVRIVSMGQEQYLMRGSTFENYAKSNDFVESEDDEDSERAYNFPSIGYDVWAEDEEPSDI